MHTAHGYAAHSSSTPLVPHTLVGNIAETQALLDFCAKHNVLAGIERTPIQKIQSAFDRVTANDIKYRFVIDMSSLQQQPA